MLKQFLFKQVPNWLRDIVYVVALLETIIVVVHYFKPELLVKALMWI